MFMPKSSRRTANPKHKQVQTLPLYILLVALFALYLFFQAVPFLALVLGLLLLIVFVLLIVLELAGSVAEEGLTRSALEIAVAIVAVFLLWYGARFLLHTAYPLDVVPSCSMQPHLNRGDVILLQGVTNVSQLNAPVVKVSKAAYDQMNSSITGEFLACVAYNASSGRVRTSQLLRPGYSIGLYNELTGAIVQPGMQSGNLVQYTCGADNVTFSNGTTGAEAYTAAVTIAGSTIIGDKNDSVVVYQTVPSDLFYRFGDSYIVHRVYAVINASGSYYVLTKGDNNPGLDMQYGNYPAGLGQTQGKVVASVPYLGYIKLIFAESYTEPAGCNVTMSG
jgi:signal peptidase I